MWSKSELIIVTSLIVFVVSIITGIFVTFYFDSKTKEEMYYRCLQDKKDYECYSMIYKESGH